MRTNRTSELVTDDKQPMKTLKTIILLVLTGASASIAADAQETPISLEQARELGRVKSRFLKETQADATVTNAIPEANLAYFQQSVRPIVMVPRSPRAGFESIS